MAIYAADIKEAVVRTRRQARSQLNFFCAISVCLTLPGKKNPTGFKLAPIADNAHLVDFELNRGERKLVVPEPLRQLLDIARPPRLCGGDSSARSAKHSFSSSVAIFFDILKASNRLPSLPSSFSCPRFCPFHLSPLYLYLNLALPLFIALPPTQGFV